MIFMIFMLFIFFYFRRNYTFFINDFVGFGEIQQPEIYY